MNAQQKKDLHQKTQAQLQKELATIELDLAKAKLERSAQKLEDTSKPDRLRKQVARIKTILKQKQTQAKKNKKDK